MTYTLIFGLAIGFLIFNAIVLTSILFLQHSSTKSANLHHSMDFSDVSGIASLHKIRSTDILNWEFEYARITASEALSDRHVMINFFLIIIGVAISGLFTYYTRTPASSQYIGTIFLWGICGVGWFYFLILIQLRKAWYDSVLAMNKIKEFCIASNCDFPAKVLAEAFHWKVNTVPARDKPWTVFFLSAMLIGFLNSTAFFSGGLLLLLETQKVIPLVDLLLITILAFIFFGLHALFYFLFLKHEQCDKPCRSE